MEQIIEKKRKETDNFFFQRLKPPPGVPYRYSLFSFFFNSGYIKKPERIPPGRGC
jgi:hypothetical protein